LTSTLRYTELFKGKGPQKARLKKGWIEVEIGVPQSWWYNDDVEGYKKHLSQAKRRPDCDIEPSEAQRVIERMLKRCVFG
jgi:hypothetical protein